MLPLLVALGRNVEEGILAVPAVKAWPRRISGVGRRDHKSLPYGQLCVSARDGPDKQKAQALRSARAF